MNLQRVLTMKTSELAFRCRQQAYRTIGRLTTPDGETAALRLLDCRGGDAELQGICDLFAAGETSAGCAGLYKRFWQQTPGRFFAGVYDAGAMKCIARDCTELRRMMIESADAVCLNQFDILGFGKLFFGAPVEWQGDPCAVAHLPWSGTDLVRGADAADRKIVSELNRHQWVLDLGGILFYRRRALCAGLRQAA